jgi:hypothetical protein
MFRASATLRAARTCHFCTHAALRIALHVCGGISGAWPRLLRAARRNNGSLRRAHRSGIVRAPRLRCHSYGMA